MQNLKYKFRLYPNKEQLAALSQVAGGTAVLFGTTFLQVNTRPTVKQRSLTSLTKTVRI